MVQTLAPQMPMASPRPPHLPKGQRVLLSNISWELYLAISNARYSANPRLTYDDGLLEVAMTGRLHEQMGELVREMISMTLKKQRITYEPAGSTTWQREDLRKGLEADACYHIQTVSRVFGRSELDLIVDPPPDLAVEVEVTSPLLNKTEVYRGLRVPELWRLRADCSCEMYRLDSNQVYVPMPDSIAVLPMTASVVSQYLLLREKSGHSATIERFGADFLAAVIGSTV